jgi:hypothetical protein
LEGNGRGVIEMLPRLSLEARCVDYMFVRADIAQAEALYEDFQNTGL